MVVVEFSDFGCRSCATFATSTYPALHIVRYETVEVVDGELVIHPDSYGRGTTHAEAVYQALLTTGVDAGDAPSWVQELLATAREPCEDHAHPGFGGAAPGDWGGRLG